MKVHAMGIGFVHNDKFCINRPCGSGDNLLLIFLSNSFVELDGKRFGVSPCSAIVYPKGKPQIYGANDEKYVNHWVHFECDESDSFFDRPDFAFGKILPVGDITGTEKILGMLSIETLSDGNEERADLLLRLLISKLCSESSRHERTAHGESLRKLRAEIYSSASEKFSVEMLAEKLSLSPSYFQHIYRREFGISCYEDVLHAKSELAKYYLLNTDFTVNEISALCGFENGVHFMRQFRKRTGMTPTGFRERG